MDENLNLPEDSIEKREPVRFTGRDWLAVALAFGVALLWQAVFGFESMINHGIPALGITVFVFALYAAVFICLGKSVRLDRVTTLMLAAVGLLAVSCTIFGNVAMRIINCFVILGVGAITMFRMSGQALRRWHDPVSVGETICLSFKALFRYWGKPFKALMGTAPRDGKKLAGVAIGVIAAIPLFTVVIGLLISADSVFEGMFGEIGAWFQSLNLGSAVWRVIRTLIFTLIFFSALYSLRQKVKSPEDAEQSRAQPDSETPDMVVPTITVLVLLDIVYAVFVVIQFAFLFGGAQTAAMKGGYAEYARSGFFQLVAVTVINIIVGLAASALTVKSPKNITPVKALSIIMLAFTTVILVSAAWRMSLYISAYGMSLLRAMTLWGMFFSAVCIAAALVKIIRPSFRFFGVFFAVGLASWVAFSLCNIDARIANYNVDAYLDGRLEDVDIQYLRNLSPDVLPALERLRDEVGGGYTGPAAEGRYYYQPYNLNEAIEELRGVEAQRWQTWNLSQIRYG